MTSVSTERHVSHHGLRERRDAVGPGLDLAADRFIAVQSESRLRTAEVDVVDLAVCIVAPQRHREGLVGGVADRGPPKGGAIAVSASIWFATAVKAATDSPRMLMSPTVFALSPGRGPVRCNPPGRVQRRGWFHSLCVVGNALEGVVRYDALDNSLEGSHVWERCRELSDSALRGSS